MRAIGVVCVLVVALSATMASATVDYTTLPWTGSLDTSGITGTLPDLWPDGSMSIAWDVSRSIGPEDEYYTWHYQYTVTVPGGKAVSHLTFEVSDGVGAGDVQNVAFADDGVSVNANTSFGTYRPGDKGEPGLPADMYGMKFENPLEGGDLGTGILQFSFDTLRTPVWGDFYAKDGVDDGTNLAAWNTGFRDTYPGNSSDNTDEDPDIYVYGGEGGSTPYFADSYLAHILVPDSMVMDAGGGLHPAVPELPPTLLAAMLPAVGLLVRRLKSR